MFKLFGHRLGVLAGITAPAIVALFGGWPLLRDSMGAPVFYAALAAYVVWVAYLFAKVRFEFIPQAGEDEEEAGLGTRSG